MVFITIVKGAQILWKWEMNLITQSEMTRATTKQQLLDLGWEDKGDVLVRYSNPRIGWKPADGTLIVGYHECPYKCYNVEQIMNAIQ